MKLLAVKFKKKSKDKLYVGLANLFIQDYHPSIKIERYESSEYIVIISEFDYFSKTISNILEVFPKSIEKITIMSTLEGLTNELILVDDEITSFSLDEILKHKTVNPTEELKTSDRNKKLINYLSNKECFKSLVIEYYKSQYITITREESQDNSPSFFKFLSDLKKLEKNPLIFIFNSL